MPADEAAVHRAFTRADPESLRFTAACTTTWRRWGDEVAVHDSRLAQTHLLRAAHGEVFALLAAGPGASTLADIAEAFIDGDAAPDGQSIDDDERTRLHDVLQELVGLGLATATPA